MFSLISEIPYCLAFTKQGVIEFYGLNMIFTLLLCFWILCAMENIPAGAVRNVLIALLIFLSLFCDWALLAPVFTLLFAWARNSEKRLKIAFTAAAAMFGVMSLAGGAERFSTGTNILYALGCMAGIALSGIVIVCFYNGRRAGAWKMVFQVVFLLVLPGSSVDSGRAESLSADSVIYPGKLCCRRFRMT